MLCSRHTDSRLDGTHPHWRWVFLSPFTGSNVYLLWQHLHRHTQKQYFPRDLVTLQSSWHQTLTTTPSFQYAALEHPLWLKSALSFIYSVSYISPSNEFLVYINPLSSEERVNVNHSVFFSSDLGVSVRISNVLLKSMAWNIGGERIRDYSEINLCRASFLWFKMSCFWSLLSYIMTLSGFGCCREKFLAYSFIFFLILLGIRGKDAIRIFNMPF